MTYQLHPNGKQFVVIAAGVPDLKALAPTHSEPPFMITQLIVLALFVVLAITASIRFRDAQVRSA